MSIVEHPVQPSFPAVPARRLRLISPLRFDPLSEPGPARAFRLHFQFSDPSLGGAKTRSRHLPDKNPEILPAVSANNQTKNIKDNH
ncbi:MAG: hypothetical protein JF609_06510 [Verrucomicrobia bacterium]|nr:hypothetical protein [Verrucomicrobiota bacterium]